MGHRYYDPRTGRFISQDPAGSGDNWYVYADNNPVNNVDPSGLYATWPGDGIPFPQPELGSVIDSLPDGTYNLYISNNGGKDSTYLRTITVGIGFVHSLGSGGFGGTPGTGMFAGDNNKADGSKWYKSKSGDHDPPHVHQGKDGPRYNRAGNEIKPNGDEIKGGGTVTKSRLKDFRKVFDNLNPPRPGAAAAAGEGAAEEAVIVGAERGAELLGPVGMIIGAGIAAWDIYHHPDHAITTLTWTGPNDPRASE